MRTRFALALLLLVGCTCQPGECGGTQGSKRFSGPPHPVVVMKTSMGDITLELDREKAPETVENFLRYAKDGFYDGTIFHRVIDGFMVQGGGFDRNMVAKKPRPPVRNESQNGLRNMRGTIAMARAQDPDSATSQFFINVVDNPNLDYPEKQGYTVFGKVVVGMEIVDRIKSVPTQTFRRDSPRMELPNAPVTPVVIESVRLK